MALRTSELKVKEVISTALTTPQINAFIADASLWVDEELASSGLSAERLTVIEKYLACAFIRVRDLGVSSVKMDDIAEKYQVDPEVTDYLLRVASLDSTGTIRKYFMAPKNTRTASARIGTRYIDV